MSICLLKVNILFLSTHFFYSTHLVKWTCAFGLSVPHKPFLHVQMKALINLEPRNSIVSWNLQKSENWIEYIKSYEINALGKHPSMKNMTTYENSFCQRAIYSALLKNYQLKKLIIRMCKKREKNFFRKQVVVMHLFASICTLVYLKFWSHMLNGRVCVCQNERWVQTQPEHAFDPQ